MQAGGHLMSYPLLANTQLREQWFSLPLHSLSLSLYLCVPRTDLEISAQLWESRIRNNPFQALVYKY